MVVEDYGERNRQNALRHAQADADASEKKLADLQRQLREAQERADKNYRLYTELRQELDKALAAAETAIELGQQAQEERDRWKSSWRAQSATVLPLQAERAAAIKRGTRAIHYLCGTSGALREIVDTLLVEAEAAEALAETWKRAAENATKEWAEGLGISLCDERKIRPAEAQEEGGGD